MKKGWRLTLLLAAILLGLVALPIYPIAPAPPAVDLQEVDPAIAETIKRRQLIARLLPRSGTAWGRLGTAFYMHHFNAQAEQAFALAERFSPREPRWPYLRALSMAEEDLEATLPILRRAAERAGNGPAAPRLRLAELALERGLLEESEAQLAHVLQLDPQDPRALLNMGRLEFARDRLAESRAFLERSLERARKVKATHLLLSTVLQRLGEKDRSARALQTSSELPEKTFWPDLYRQEAVAFWAGKDALLSRGNDAITQRKLPLARDFFQKAADDYPANELAWLGLGTVQRVLGDRAAARHALQKALAVAPGSVQSQIEMGGVLYDDKEHVEAERHFREALRLNPEQAEAWHNLGLCLTGQSRAAEAIPAFEKALALKPDSAQSLTFLGQALAIAGQLPAAAEKLDRSLSLDPQSTAAQILREQVRKAMESGGKN